MATKPNPSIIEIYFSALSFYLFCSLEMVFFLSRSLDKLSVTNTICAGFVEWKSVHFVRCLARVNQIQTKHKNFL